MSYNYLTYPGLYHPKDFVVCVKGLPLHINTCVCPDGAISQYVVNIAKIGASFQQIVSPPYLYL